MTGCYNLRNKKMPTPANGEREVRETSKIEQLKKALEDREKEIAALREKSEENHLREMEVRRRERRQLESQEEEHEQLQEQLRQGKRRP